MKSNRTFQSLIFTIALNTALCSANAQTPLPAEVTLRRSVSFPVIVDGATVGEMEVEAGEKVKLLGRDGDELRVLYNNSSAVIPKSHTDFDDLVSRPAETPKPKTEDAPPAVAPPQTAAPVEPPVMVAPDPPPLLPAKLPAQFDTHALSLARSVSAALLWSSEQVKPAYVTVVVDDKTIISGVVIDSSGLVLTSHAALKGNTQPSVRIRGASSRSHQSRVAASDPASGIALLKIGGDNFSAAKLGNSDALRAGDWVATIGNTKDKAASVNHGIISGLNRSSNAVKIPLLQSNAFTHLGDIGGPLINLDGEVVGIIVQSAAVGSEPVRAGFVSHTLVVPSNYLVRLLSQWKAYAK
jgi:S1-C subfamily serine protease